MPAVALRAQAPLLTAPGEIAAAEHDRVLRAADAALEARIDTLPPVPAARRLPAGTFFSELHATDVPELHLSPAAAALKQASMHVAALTAAYVLTGADRYALRAGQWLFAWFVAPATRMLPEFAAARCAPGTADGSPEGLLDAAPLAELARAVPFLVDTAALAPPDHDALVEWFRQFQQWLDTARVAQLARDSHDHTGTATLLITACCARLLRDDKALTAASAFFKRPTLRQQVHADGSFPAEVRTRFPYRNTLLNFELLTAACSTLSTPFNDLWNFELPDGPGLRSVAAYLYPMIRSRAVWPWPADVEGFRDLPARRHALLFAGRAYARPEYVALWKELPDGSNDPTLLPSLPVTQPIVWTSRAPHGA